MKQRVTGCVFMLFLLASAGLYAQPGIFGGPIMPLQQNRSILFGYDTYLNDQPLQNQRNMVICSAFNGWLYAAYSYFDNNLQQDATTILRSKDNGANWSVLFDQSMGEFHNGFSKMNILACGHDTTNIKVFIGFGIFDTLTLVQCIWVVRFDKDGVVELGILQENSGKIRDFALSSDDLFPANNSNPFSIGVVYSKGTNFSDSIVFWSSSDGGMTFDKHYNIAASSHYFHKVALAYGRSPSCPGGRYFAAWEEQENKNSVSGHLYTAHSEPNFDSPFTAPLLIDSLDATTANKASNPAIACQHNGVDNDSSNLTEVVLFEKYQPATQDFNIAGFYNKKATSSGNFFPFSINTSGNNIIQPDIAFNPYDSTFMVTCFDSAGQKLPYYIHDFNMTEPDAWTELSSGYNDDDNLVAPHPQITMDFGSRTGANAWIGARPGGNGAAMFDSPFTYYTGIPNTDKNNGNRLVKTYPNPCNTTITVTFKLAKTEKVTLNVTGISGQPMGCFANQSYPAGEHGVPCDVSNLKPGTYLYHFKAGEHSCAGKFTVLR